MAEALAPPALRQIWLRMTAMYGHKWTAAMGDAAENDDGRLTEFALTWAKGLAGLTGPQLGAGLKACLAASDPWPPTLPAFRGMCLGIPGLSAVQLILSDSSRPMTPFVRLVWSFVDAYRYRTAAADKADRIIRDAYDIAREHVMNGGSMPDAVSGVIGSEKPVHVPASAESAKEHIAKVTQLLRSKQPPPEDDNPEPPRAA